MEDINTLREIQSAEKAALLGMQSLNRALQMLTVTHN